MKKNLLLILLTSLVIVSCQQDFDEPNPNQASIDNFWQTGDDAVLGVNAIYSVFRRGYAGFGRAMYFHGMLRSDEGYGSGGDIGLNILMNFNMTDTNFGLTADTWDNLYVGVYRANQVIAYVPGIDMDANLKKRVIGEAKFLRGLFYYYLTLYYGRPPLILEPSQPTMQPPNATEAQAWAQVTKDLSEAAVDLPIQYASAADLGRATKGAAYALLGKAYLQQGMDQPAADAFEELITGEAAVYDLMPNYRDNFLITSENNVESVFEIQFARNDNENGDDDINPNINLNVGASIAKFYAPNGPGFQDGGARRWVVNEMSLEKTTTTARDPRVAATFLFDSTDVGGPDDTMVYGSTWLARYGTNNSSVFYRKLLNDHWRDDERFNSPNNYRLIRYADVLLLYAEALNNLDRTAEAYPFVDRVRERAGLAKLSTAKPGLSQTQFHTQLKHERITELSGEGWRWADLKRWGDLSADLAVRDPEFTNFVVGKHEVYPIPGRDIDLNVSLTQNDNY
jgi:starch-binding outer membrane protein, SusD/RagB family